eukprot:COSAG05_NODE_801_length_7224_cov_4.552000_10_plen_156_part_00
MARRFVWLELQAAALAAKEQALAEAHAKHESLHATTEAAQQQAASSAAQLESQVLPEHRRTPYVLLFAHCMVTELLGFLVLVWNLVAGGDAGLAAGGAGAACELRGGAGERAGEAGGAGGGACRRSGATHCRIHPLAIIFTLAAFSTAHRTVCVA